MKQHHLGLPCGYVLFAEGWTVDRCSICIGGPSLLCSVFHPLYHFLHPSHVPMHIIRGAHALSRPPGAALAAAPVREPRRNGRPTKRPPTPLAVATAAAAAARRVGQFAAVLDGHGLQRPAVRVEREGADFVHQLHALQHSAKRDWGAACVGKAGIRVRSTKQATL